MSRALTFDTPIDEWVRSTGMTRAQLAEEALVSPATLLKARALDPNRGRLHFSSLVLIGYRKGVFKPWELIDEGDPRLLKLAPRGLITSRGRCARHWHGQRRR